MRFFRRKEQIYLDEEEQQAVKHSTDFVLGDDRVPSSREVAEEMYRTFGGMALQSLAVERLKSGNLTGAISTCLKATSLFPENPDGWLVAAEVHAKAGYKPKALQLLREADQRYKRAFYPGSSGEAFWKLRVKELEDVIQST